MHPMIVEQLVQIEWRAREQRLARARLRRPDRQPTDRGSVA